LKVKGIQLSKFVIITGGNIVSWLPEFATRAEAEERMNSIGEGGGWEERTEVVEVED
jgi:hypothetical protein